MAGLKGEGKTRRLIDTANERVGVCKGNIVFIDDDRRHIHDVHKKIRFVCTEDFPLATHRELGAFIHGILSQDGDIREMYLDGLNNLVKSIDNDGCVELAAILTAVSKSYDVAFTLSINSEKEALPKELQALVV